MLEDSSSIGVNWAGLHSLSGQGVGVGVGVGKGTRKCTELVIYMICICPQEKGLANVNNASMQITKPAGGSGCREHRMGDRHFPGISVGRLWLTLFLRNQFFSGETCALLILIWPGLCF